MRFKEVSRPSAKAPPGAPNSLRARLWRATKRMLRQWLVSYHMEIPDEFANTSSPSSQPNRVHGVNGVNGGVGASSDRAVSQEPSEAGDPCIECGELSCSRLEGGDCAVATAIGIQCHHDHGATCRTLPGAVARGSQREVGSMHGGLSTGPRTAAGQYRVGEAARQRAQRKKTHVA
jgi:hypothetical protein